MTVIARDEFTYSAPPTSGAAEYTATDNTATYLYMDSNGSPTTGDTVAFTQTFTGGTVTIQARWSSSTTLLLERISTIAGTSNGTATLATITGSSTSKPRTDGDLVRIRITVNRGAVDALTAIGWGWAARSSGTEQNSGTFNVDGELTPSAGAFTVSGSSFANRPDIEGTTPDTIALGTWARVSQLSSNGQVDWLGTESDGECRPQRIGSNEVVYALQGTGIGGDYTVRATATYTAGEFPGLLFAGRLSGSAGSLAGYVVYFGGPDSVEISEWASGSFSSSLDFEVVTAYDDEAPHVFEVIFADDVVTVTIDGTTVATASGLTTLTGDPGVGGYRSDRTIAGLAINDWELDDTSVAPPPPPDPCVVEIARDDFLVFAADLDSQPLTRPVTAFWQAHPASAGIIKSQGDPIGNAIVLGSGRGVYLARATGVGSDYCVQVIPRFPIDPGTPGSVPWMERWRYHITGHDGAPLFADRTFVTADGYCDELVTDQEIVGMTINGFTTWSSGQPKDFSLGAENATVNSAAGSQAHRTIMFYTTLHVTAGSHEYPVPALTWEYYILPDFTYLSPDTNGGYSDVDTDWDLDSQQRQAVDGDPGNNVGPTISPTSGTVSQWSGPGGITTPPTSSNPTPVLHLRFGGGAPFSRNEIVNSTGGGVSFSGDNATGSITHYWPEFPEDGVTSFVAGTAPSDLGGEVADAAALVCYDEAADSGYRLRLLFDHTGMSPVGDLRLEVMDAGTPTLMSQWTPDVDHETDYSVLLRLEGTVLVAVFEGDVMGTFDVATDLADETSALVTDYTGTGFPGLAMYDASETGAYMTVDRVVIYNGCTGGPENPYPRNPPPPVDPGPVLLYRKTATVWLGITAPTPADPSTVQPRHRVAATPSQDLRIRDRVMWVQLSQGSVQLPPPDTTFPPYFDPCEILDPDNPDDFPPIGDVSPVPYAGGRFYGMQAYPVTLFNSIFNASQRAAELPSLLTDLTQAAARSGVIVGAQGGYKKFISPVTGYYSPALMDAFIETHSGGVGTTMLAAQTAGTLACVIIADDFRVQRLWPTSAATGGGIGQGLSDAELTRIAAKWLSVVPGLRLGIRARPRTFAAPITGLTVYGTQYDGPQQVGKSYGQVVTYADFRAWRNAELARLVGWGGGLQAILSPNYLHGGADLTAPKIYTGTGFDGRPVMTTTELTTCADAWFDDAGGGYDDRIIGSCGYLYHPDLITIAGYLDACTYFRNGLMGLPSL